MSLSVSRNEPLLGSLNANQITQYFANEPRFGGVFANDEMKKPDQNKAYILNLENSSEGGSHWVALIGTQYFDPYGVPPTKAISRFAKEYSVLGYQSLSQEDCGFFCIYFIDNWLKGRNPLFKLHKDQYSYNYQVLKRHFF
jgi:hypothetical protein